MELNSEPFKMFVFNMDS